MVSKEAVSEGAAKAEFPAAPVVAAWLVPGGGHFWLRRWGRGAILLGTVGAMFVAGAIMQGRLFEPELSDVLKTVAVLLFIGWLISGTGHLWETSRGKVILISVSTIFLLGIRYNVLVPTNIVETLGFLGDLCAGLLFVAARLAGYEAVASGSPIVDYGTKFLLVAGLLNVLCVLDAYDIAVGNKD